MSPKPHTCPTILEMFKHVHFIYSRYTYSWFALVFLVMKIHPLYKRTTMNLEGNIQCHISLIHPWFGCGYYAF